MAQLGLEHRLPKVGAGSDECEREKRERRGYPVVLNVMMLLILLCGLLALGWANGMTSLAAIRRKSAQEFRWTLLWNCRGERREDPVRMIERGRYPWPAGFHGPPLRARGRPWSACTVTFG